MATKRSKTSVEAMTNETAAEPPALQEELPANYSNEQDAVQPSNDSVQEQLVQEAWNDNIEDEARDAAKQDDDGHEADRAVQEDNAKGHGAKILRNRFSSWREMANETMKNPNLQAVLKTNVAQNITARPMFAARQTNSPASSVQVSISSSISSDSEPADVETRHPRVPAGMTPSSVVDTVASGFRGRYSGGTAPLPEPLVLPQRQQMMQSQTTLILQSRAATHMQSIIDSLEKDEYVMLLGNGMLGVNLKQAFLKNNGVYMDYLVDGGAAELSGVICVGDSLMKVGDVDVYKKGLILNVPQTIAGAKRPVVLVLSTGQQVPEERMNYVDVAVGMMHKFREEKDKLRDIASLPLNDQGEEQPSYDNGAKETDPTNGLETDSIVDGTKSEEATIDVAVASPCFRGPDPMNVPLPPLALRKLVLPYVARRCNDKFALSTLCKAADADANFRAVLQNAFVTCVIDGRRLPFLSAHLSFEDSYDGKLSLTDDEDYQRTTSSTQLMLFLELTTFVELYFLTPETKRRDIAKRIAFKFFLPSTIGNNLEPPMFDFHHIVSDTDLRALENALNDTENPVGRYIFVPFQEAIMESLSGPPFLTFLMSNDCARMRAYLRNTAPFRTVCPGIIFDCISGEKENAATENNLLSLLLHLICQLEKEVGDEHVELGGDNQERVMGAAGGVACAVYIKRRLLRCMEAAKKSSQLESEDKDESFVAIIETMELVWETFIAPGGGMLDSISKSNETDTYLKKVRERLGAAVATLGCSSENDKDALIRSLTSTELIEAFETLSDNLLYDYAASVYSKFKEHRFHEWMCNEINLAKSDSESEASVPLLQPGCIGRLLRKAKLPPGVSPHKPIRSTQQSPASPSKDESTKIQNAEFAVIFGTDDGSGEINPVPNPAMDRTDIRRYICQPIVNGEDSPSTAQFRVPQTLESYVTVPPLRRTPFSSLVDDTRISADGWEISLVNFMVPNADTASESHRHDEKALFGVSLVFQKSDDALIVGASHGIHAGKTELVVEQTPAATPSGATVTLQKSCNGDHMELRPFASPIRFLSPASATAQNTTESTRAIVVSVKTPKFNRRLEKKPWSERMEDRKRVVTGPVTIGIALVCRSNVVLAMRDTLSRFLLDHARSLEVKGNSPEGKPKLVCGSLIELLGNFSHPDVEPKALNAILEPYLRFGSSPWVDRPLQDQKREFEILAGQQLLNCLPPIPLALLFVTLLLEQKVVFSSSRRSVLFSAISSVTRLLEPLSWSHLLVPLVPSALALDLLQYPAPFILGISSEDPGNMDVLRSLPADVTLVDLDVGRVILAPSFAHDDELVRGSETRTVTQAALRSQVLYLAQSLGLLFGARLHEDTWNVDSPATSLAVETRSGLSDVEKLQSVCRSFLVELLTGTSSCCFWIEEQRQGTESAQTGAECTVLFDEDRFFHIKNLRARGRYNPLFTRGSPFKRNDRDGMDGPMLTESCLALSIDDFDLILESFLRCQSMSTFVSSRPKTRMAYF